MRLDIVCGLMSLALVLGCAVPRTPREVSVYPITSGFHRSLPSRDARILIWGKQPVNGMATTWIQTHGFTAVPSDHIRSFLPPELVGTLAYTSKDAPLILTHGRAAPVDLVLFADFEVSAEAASSVIGDFSSTYMMDVTVWGIDVHTSAVEWKGNAHYPPRSDLPADGLAQLTCQALATAWGFRPSGQLEIPSSMMCTAGQAEPILLP